jgi:kynurenine formamidase
MVEADTLPKFSDLPQLPTGERHSWDVFGRADQLGTLNLITPRQVLKAVRTVTEGRVINLSLPLNLPDPSLVSTRRIYEHYVSTGRLARDDWLDGFYPQASTQWDGLQHIRYRQFGFYGGREDADLDQGELGIDVIARRGIVGRGVLVDVPACFEALGRPLPPDRRTVLRPHDVETVLAWEKVEIEPGDILVIRTGWVRWYLGLDEAARKSLAGGLDGGTLETVGLDPGQPTAAWLWDHRVAAVAADNPAVEALPVRREEGFLHQRLIALLGMPLGELWDLEELSAACRELGRYYFLLVSAPLNIPRGVGSPANAYAIL